MEVPEEVVYNLMCDTLKHKRIDKFDKAKLIKTYMDNNKLSISKVAKEFNIHEGTIRDWLSYNNIDREYYEDLKQKGLSLTDIYKELRQHDPTINDYKLKYSPLDFKLIQVNKLLRKLYPFVKSKNTRSTVTNETDNILSDIEIQLNQLKNEINKKKLKMEQKQQQQQQQDGNQK